MRIAYRVLAPLGSAASRTIHFLKSAALTLWHWIEGLVRAAANLWRALGPRWLRVCIALAAVVLVAHAKLAAFLKPNLTQETVYRVQYLNGGWSDRERQSYYYTPQGTELLGIEYDWFQNLELPLSQELLASERNMRGWGFVVDPNQRPSPLNPGNLPVGLTRHIDPASGRARLDIGCAACHTGELHYQGTALRVDGGQAMQSIPNAKRGEFITTLGASVFETLLNPAKWNRFATRLVGDDGARREALRTEFWQFAQRLKHFSETAGAPKYYPVEEGRGRTDAIGRIANVVFGYDLKQPENYRPADAPASYPFIWDIWRFDWVQYTGFTNQAMTRNVGESLGVLAPIKLVDDDGEVISGSEFGETTVDLDGMHCVEGLLRKLQPPKWPEDVLGEIDVARARAGKALFTDQCAFCHGPHVSEPYDWQLADGPDARLPGQLALNWQWDMAGEVTRRDGLAYRADWRETMWALPWIATDVVGTDPKLADNFVDNRYDISKLFPGEQPVNAGYGLQLLLNDLVPKLYRQWDIDDAQQVADFDGLNVPFRIENKRAYKSRPLHGVWATPPFLHNGSVPTIYDLLSPLRARPKTFYAGNREFDPNKLGYVTGQSPGSFLMDTSIDGNRNSGHLFTDVDMPGRIGKLLSEEERYAIIEYLKVMGNPEFDSALGGDPMNWASYSPAPARDSTQQACKSVHFSLGIDTGSETGQLLAQETAQ
ncbi:di-heme-cytochrome C peroxidase [Microbulbifer taiwanensis]|uniref:Di-heme-cytochrome C peroxidase n=1 Tax=Microbulbifer taiwanensis TaxID=986746 RepID=A0ABW1YK91_9GAMM|nr:di-heme-cytochrome C peroxidase [Microbulbifer taiwanensis]